jgi:D-3-phosphoglycerate dehydrogenase / 2-oxoglutarate reductase
MTYQIAVTDSPTSDDLSIERKVLVDMQVEKVSWHDESSLIAAVQDAHAIMCMHAPINQVVIGSLRCCKAIVRFGTGLDNIDRSAASKAGIPVIGIHDYCTQEVADHVLALLLAWNRKIVAYHQFVIDKRWNERKQTTGNWGCGPLYSLSGRTLGLLGFGYIGRAVARRALAFNMTVIACSRNPDRSVAQQLGVELTSCEELLRRSDVLSLHVPVTDETQHFINAKTIAQMKPGAVLINTSRGGLVEEPMLIDALRSGQIGAALLDVYEQAPLPVDHPFRALDNVLMTPHVAFYSEDSLQRLRRLTAEAVLKCLS